MTDAAGSESRRDGDKIDPIPLEEASGIEPGRVAEIAATLVRFDTAYAGPGSEARQESELQNWLADFLAALDFDVRVWEPRVDEVRSHRMYQQGLDWRGRPVLSAVRRAGGGGRSLLLNGHIDTVGREPVDAWTHDPWDATVDGSRLFGRGACDMKGGLAAALAAVEALARSGIQLGGDLWVQTAPDEETSGMGVVALLARGIPRVDAALVPEPTSFEVYTAYRGILSGRIEIEGRAAHAEMPQPPFEEGGAVSAVDKGRLVLDTIDDLNAHWNEERSDKRHRLLPAPRVVVTEFRGGGTVATIPGRAELAINVTYLPGDSDVEGFGSRVKAEVEERLGQVADADSWLRDHRPTVVWKADYPPAEADPDSEFVRTLRRVAGRDGHEVPATGLPSWADAATYLANGIPAYCFGPGSMSRAHIVDEWVSLDELSDCARAFRALIAEWCG